MNESDKISAEISHLIAETILLNKKTRWFEATILLTVAGVAIAFTKIFL